LGDGLPLTDSAVPVVVNLSDITHLSAGSDHTCALLITDEVRCWGANSSGQLGNGTNTQEPDPVPVPGFGGGLAATPVVPAPSRVTAGGDFSCALNAGSDVECWGADSRGQLGNGATVDSITPQTVIGLHNVDQVSASSDWQGQSFACAIAGGDVWCWGVGGSGQMGDGSVNYTNSTPHQVSLPHAATQVTTGDGHACALLDDGSVQCWGRNDHGQLGRGSEESVDATPKPVKGIKAVTQIAAQGDTTCALLTGGHVACFGYNQGGQLGNQSTNDSLFPVPVGVVNVTQIAVGGSHACGLLVGGSIDCWGNDGVGQFGNGSTTNTPSAPTPVSSISGAVEVTAGSAHTCAILLDRTASCWGANNDRQLGIGDISSINSQSLLPQPVLDLAGVTQIAAGFNHTCAIDAVDTLSCWGSNQRGELANQWLDYALSPMTPPVFGTGRWSNLAIGNSSSCGVMNGVAECWGDNTFGQLGDGTKRSHDQPLAVMTTGPVAQVAVNTYFSCALLMDGSVECWGGQINGSELGRIDPGSKLAPGPVSGISHAVQISIGDGGGCARIDDGTVRCWGYFPGVDEANNRSTTAVQPAITGVVDVESGGLHSCAALSSGEVSCWGNNHYGELGFDTPLGYQSTPHLVPGLTGITSVKTGASNSCALGSGHVWCWGDGEAGQVGDGYVGSGQPFETHNVLSPFPVPVSNISELGMGNGLTCGVQTSGAVDCWGSAGFARSSTPTAVASLQDVTHISEGWSGLCVTLSDESLRCLGDNYYGELGRTPDFARPVPIAGVL
jgi:alpha-tubulin suppressor-like RCC1 family protein